MTTILPPLTAIPAEIVAVQDYVPYAYERMSAQAWAYFSGGAADEQLMRRNEAGAPYRIWPRVLNDLSHASTQLQLLGQTYAYPLFLAPVAYQKLAHTQGELASALAAAAMQTPFIISMQASQTIEAIAHHAPGPQWLQWYWQPDTQATERLLQRAVAAGIQAIVLTVDAPVNGIRNTEQRAQFALPEPVAAVNLKDMHIPVPPVVGAGQSPLFGTGYLATRPTWHEVAQFIKHSPLPVWLKGILHPLDAQQAVEIGAAGVIISNHGGRVLDASPTAWEVLPLIAQAVDRRIPILMDGGIRRGTDIFVALALGAQAVLIGRPYVYALAAAGAAGVAHVLHILRTELEVAMALAGCAQLADINQANLMPLA